MNTSDAVAETDEHEDVKEQPRKPRDRPGKLAAGRDRRSPTRGRRSPCCRGRGRRTSWSAVRATRSRIIARRMGRPLHGRLRHAGQRLPILVKKCGRVADRRTPPDDRESTGPASTSTRPARSSGTPSVATSGDAATPAAHSTVPASSRSRPEPHAMRVDRGHGGALAHVDAEPLQRAARRASRSFSGNVARIVGPGLDEHDAGARWCRWTGIRRAASAARSPPACRPARRRSARRRPARTSAAPAASRDRVSRSARSKASRMRRRISSASSSVFRPGAYCSHSG